PPRLHSFPTRRSSDLEHAQSLVVFDEAHAAHIGGEVVDGAAVAAAEGFLAGVFQIQIELEIFHFGENLIPLIERLDVDRADVGRSEEHTSELQSPYDL